MFNISKTEYKKIDKKSIVSEKAGLCFCQNYDKVTVITKSGILRRIIFFCALLMPKFFSFKYRQKTAQTKSRKVLYNKILSF